MAGMIRDDEIDWGVYAEQTDAGAKVRPASQWAASVVDQFDVSRQGRLPEMLSTKLRGALRFRPGEITVWAGHNGMRKSIFMGQLALDFCAQRSRTLLASFEMAPETTLARMARQALAEERPATEGILRFMSWTDERLWVFDHSGRVSPARLLAVLRYFAAEKSGTQIIVDSMMMVVGSEEHMDEQKQFVTDLVRVAQETGLHIHLIAHCRKPSGAGAGNDDAPPSKYDIRGSSAISDQSHNVVILHMNKPKLRAMQKGNAAPEVAIQPDFFVIVDKQRNGRFEGRIGLWIDAASLRFVDDGREPAEPYALLGGDDAPTWAESYA